MHRLSVFSALFFCAASCLAQDPNLRAVYADARAAAEKQVAIILLQRKLRPTGPVSTPEQDQISNRIAQDYQFVQERRARWRGTRYLAAYDQAFNAALRDPAFRNQDPLKGTPTLPPRYFPQTRRSWDLLSMPVWVLVLITVAGIWAASYVIGLFIRGVTFAARPLQRGTTRKAAPPPAPAGQQRAKCYLCGGSGSIKGPASNAPTQCALCKGSGYLNDE